MAHFAKLGMGNRVEKVIVVSNDVATTEQAGIDFISTTRVPTRCVHCKRVWAIEIQDGKGTKFEKNFLDQGLYKNIPCVEGDCIDAPDCKEYK